MILIAHKPLHPITRQAGTALKTSAARSYSLVFTDHDKHEGLKGNTGHSRENETGAVKTKEMDGLPDVLGLQREER